MSGLAVFAITYGYTLAGLGLVWGVWRLLGGDSE